MIDCDSIQSKFSEYLDGRLTGHEMQSIAAHIDDCQHCSHEWAGLKKTQLALASLGPVPQPEDLLLRIRVAVSQERARSRRSLLAEVQTHLGQHSRALCVAGRSRVRQCCPAAWHSDSARGDVHASRDGARR